ncbi:MAG TPA: hypothetical protein VF531_01260 [Bacillota bacterium]
MILTGTRPTIRKLRNDPLLTQVKGMVLRKTAVTSGLAGNGSFFCQSWQQFVTLLCRDHPDTNRI